jgi:hypothetical protein
VTTTPLDGPIGWVDDELGWDAQQWADGRGRTLLVRAELEEGLTEAHTAQLLGRAELEGTISDPAPG